MLLVINMVLEAEVMSCGGVGFVWVVRGYKIVRDGEMLMQPLICAALRSESKFVTEYNHQPFYLQLLHLYNFAVMSMACTLEDKLKIDKASMT